MWSSVRRIVRKCWLINGDMDMMLGMDDVALFIKKRHQTLYIF